MEYEGFRQMVLGANLYNIKARELKDFSLGQEDRLSKVDGNIFIKLAPIYNATKTTFNNVETLDKSTKEQIYCENLKQADLFQQQIANLKCKNFREFRA
jgi:hypothetical protein